jgi:hypothetical protein
MEFVHEDYAFSFCFTISAHHFITHRKSNLISSAACSICSCGISSWTDPTGNEEMLHWSKEARNILCTIKRRKCIWVDHIFVMNCLLKHIIEGKAEGRIEVSWRSGRKQVLDDCRESKEYWKLQQKASDRALWRTRFGSRYWPAVRQALEWIN